MANQQNMFQAFGSPMLGSTIVTAPRRDGDGMDHESLMLQTGVPHPQHPPRLRHMNLNNAHGIQTVDKVKGQKVIPHEPVRGAVKPVLVPNVGAVTSKTIQESPNLKPSLQQDKFTLQDSRDLSPGKFDQSLPDAAKTTDDKFSLTTPSENKIKNNVLLSKSLSESQLPELSQSRKLGLPSKIVAQEIALDERQVEGHRLVTTTEDFESLKKTIADLENQLEVQSKVNTDLKKLLVASMGDDLHHKVDTLVRTRAQLATDIGGYTDRIYEDHEMLDKLVIQADMWRSKFKGSRVLIDQLMAERETLSNKWADAERALQQFLQERQQLNDTLKETHRFLKILRDSFDPLSSLKAKTTIPNILELARTNHLLADSVKFRLLPAMPVFPSALDAGIQDGLTPAEKLASQVLGNSVETDSTLGGANLLRLPADKLGSYDRFHPQVRYENITFNCCAQCKGDIKVL